MRAILVPSRALHTAALATTFDERALVRAAERLVSAMLAHYSASSEDSVRETRVQLAHHGAIVLRRMQRRNALADNLLRDAEVLLCDASEFVAASCRPKASAHGKALEWLASDVHDHAADIRSAAVDAAKDGNR